MSIYNVPNGVDTKKKSVFPLGIFLCIINTKKVGFCMSNLLFTDNEVKKLRKNKYVKNVSNKSITYTDEFKEKVVFETENYKKFPRQVFEECGFDIDVIGIKRTENAAYKWRKQYKNLGELKDNRKSKSGRPLKRKLSDAEKLKRAEAKIKLLEAENELLKKNDMIQRGILTYEDIRKWKPSKK